MSSILINQIWQHNDSKYRILYFDQELDLIIWMKLDKEINSFPTEISFLEFNKLSDVKVISEPDQFLALDSLKEKSLQRLEESWLIIKELVSDEPFIFNKKYFNKRVNDCAKLHNVSRQKTRRLIFRYWHNGKSKLGIIPKYFNSGGKGKSKTLSGSHGRPRMDKKSPLILTEEMKKEIKKGYKKHYTRNPHATVNGAYLNFIRTNLRKEFAAKGFEGVPTEAQFLYWGKKGDSPEEHFRSKKGNIIYDKDMRPIEGSSYNSVDAPGTFQIDSTPGDVELISEIDGEPIGCPTIYIVSDIFSSLYMGLLITLENPSYSQASEALYNTFANKEDFFKRNRLSTIKNFNVTNDDWPSQYIPYSIVADRGVELIGKNSNNLISDLGIHIENKESYRPDLKGMIENHFNLLHLELKNLAPNIGFKMKNDGRRGASKARRTAKFTLREYTAIVVKSIVHRNNFENLSNYPLDPEMIKNGIYSPTALEVFKWGMKNRGGKLRSNNIADLKQKMFPRSEGRLTRQGIRFNKIWYSVPLHKQLKDLQIKTQNKGVKLELAYDPYNLNSIYLFYNEEIIECFLNRQKSPGYIGKSIWDVQNLNKARSVANSQNNDARTRSRMETLDFAEGILVEKKKTPTKKSTNKKKLTEAREKSKALEREVKRSQSHLENSLPKEGKVININKNNDFDFPDDTDFIEQLLDGE